MKQYDSRPKTTFEWGLWKWLLWHKSRLLPLLFFFTLYIKLLIILQKKIDPYSCHQRKQIRFSYIFYSIIWKILGNITCYRSFNGCIPKWNSFKTYTHLLESWILTLKLCNSRVCNFAYHVLFCKAKYNLISYILK